jgi:hypothetical protein
MADSLFIKKDVDIQRTLKCFITILTNDILRSGIINDHPNESIRIMIVLGSEHEAM